MRLHDTVRQSTQTQISVRDIARLLCRRLTNDSQYRLQSVQAESLVLVRRCIVHSLQGLDVGVPLAIIFESMKSKQCFFQLHEIEIMRSSPRRPGYADLLGNCSKSPKVIAFAIDGQEVSVELLDTPVCRLTSPGDARHHTKGLLAFHGASKASAVTLNSSISRRRR